MTAYKRWQYALILSLAFNVFLLGGLGLLSAGIFTAKPVEEIIEVELVSEVLNQQPNVNHVEQENLSSTTPIPLANTERTVTKSSSPVAVQQITSLNIDEVSRDGGADDMGEAQGASSASGGGAGGTSGQASTGKTGGGQGAGAGKTGGIIGPTILSKVDPSYPEAARQAGIGGTVILKVQILENGRAGEVSVKRSSGNSSLDEAAVDALYKWRFTPAKERDTGRAVKCSTTVPIVFRLN